MPTGRETPSDTAFDSENVSKKIERENLSSASSQRRKRAESSPARVTQKKIYAKEKKSSKLLQSYLRRSEKP